MLKKVKLLPLLIILGVIPWIVRLKVMDTPHGTLEYLAYPVGERNFDFFSYYKSVLIILMSSIGLLLFFWKREYIKTKYYIFLIVLGVLAILSALLSPFTPIVLKGVGDRYEGIFVWLSYLIIAFLGINLARTKKDIKILLGAAIAGITVISTIGTFQFFKLDLFKTAFGKNLILPSQWHSIADSLNFTFGGEVIYIYSTYYNPNYGGSLMAMFLFFAIMIFLNVKNKKYKLLSYLFYILIVINWIGCRSRAGFLAGQLMIIFLMFFYRKKILKKYKEILIMLVTLIAVGGIMNDFAKNTLGAKLYNTESSKYNPMREVVLTTPTNLQITTDISKINIILEGKKLIYKDEDNNLLTPKLVDKSYVFLEKKDVKYSNYKIEYKKDNYYIVHYKNFRYPLILVKNHIKTLGMGNKVSDIHMADRVKFLDGYETKGSSRVYIWSRTIPKIRKTGLLGGGPDTFSLIFPQDDNFGKSIGFSNPSIIVDKPHNMYLQLLINMGILFFITFIIFVGTYLIQSIRIYKDKKFEDFYEIVGLTMALSVGGYLVAGLFNDSVVSVAPYFWFFIGLGIAINKKLK